MKKILNRLTSGSFTDQMVTGFLLGGLLCSLIMLPISIQGCARANSTTSPAALASGYATPFDQTAGQTLAAAHALASKATTDYASLTPTQQAAEKPILNAFITALNTADSVYLAFHSGTATQAQVQVQLNAVATAQANYTAVK